MKNFIYKYKYQLIVLVTALSITSFMGAAVGYHLNKSMSDSRVISHNPSDYTTVHTPVKNIAPAPVSSTSESSPSTPSVANPSSKSKASSVSQAYGCTFTAIPYATVYKEEPLREKGDQAIEKGFNGSHTVCLDGHGGISVDTTSQPINEVIHVGTYVQPAPPKLPGLTPEQITEYQRICSTVTGSNFSECLHNFGVQ